MSYAAVMVYVEPGGGLSGRVEVARHLALRLDSNLIGVSAWMPPPPFIVEGVVVDPSPAAAELKLMQETLDKRGELFRAAATVKGRAVEWRSGLEFPTEFVARESRAADLIVVGRDENQHDPYRSTDAGALVLRAGRPVLVVPPGEKPGELRRALVAWKDTREARRAIRDALPLLRMAGEVMVVEVLDSGTSMSVSRDLSKSSQITVVAHRAVPNEVTAGNAVLHMEEEQSFDLVVSGAYGHSRLGEWLFGGVTQELLTSSPVCCLLSH